MVFERSSLNARPREPNENAMSSQRWLGWTSVQVEERQS
jgi:hypothetical protein